MAKLAIKTGVGLDVVEYPEMTYEEIVEMTRKNNEAKRKAEQEELETTNE